MLINEIDIMLLIIIIRVLYIGYKAGIFNELIKGLGVYLATVLSVHYCSSLGNYLGAVFIISDKHQDITGFTVIAVTAILLSFIIREGWMTIIKIDAHSWLFNWSGFIFSFIRVYLLCGLIFLGFTISANAWLMERVHTSASRIIFQRAAVNIYQSFYHNIVARFFPGELINQKIIDLVSAEE